MSIVQSRDNRTVLSVDETEIAEARTISASLAEVRQKCEIGFEIRPHGGQMVPVPRGLAELMRAVIDGVSRGATVTIQSVPREVTTTTAAKMLGISRPTLMKWIAEGKLPAYKVGSHTRLLASNVTAFLDKQRDAQRRAFDKLRELDEKLGIEP
jgi:excisionase family DNA binding protein